MNYKIIVVILMCALAFSFFKLRSDSKKEELELARERARSELQTIKKRNQEAKEIIKRKFAEGAKWDSSFEGYWQDVDEELLEQNKGTVTGRVDIWGVRPSAKDGSSTNSPEGILVEIESEDDFSLYTAEVDSEHRYTIIAPAGKYNLRINDPDFKPDESKVTIEPGRTNVRNRWALPAPSQ